jgi:hypothetical protein
VQFLSSITESTIEFVSFESNLRYLLSNQEFLSSPKSCTWFVIIEHQQMHYYYIHSKIHIKTLKMLLHVSNLRSSSGSVHCSLLKLYLKIISRAILYISWWCGSMSCVYVSCREVDWLNQSTSLHKTQHTHKRMTCCHITNWYKEVLYWLFSNITLARNNEGSLMMI